VEGRGETSQRIEVGWVGGKVAFTRLFWYHPA
jgi:hypothetical protein